MQTSAVTFISYFTSSVPMTAVVTAQPTALPKLIKAFSRPSSSSGTRSIAMPSTATSWPAVKKLMTNPITISRWIWLDGLSIRAMPSRLTAVPSCIARTQGLRLPIGRYS